MRAKRTPVRGPIRLMRGIQVVTETPTPAATRTRNMTTTPREIRIAQKPR